MYHAIFEAGWMTIDCTSETLSGLIDQLNVKQDLRCLIYQGLYMGLGTGRDKKELSRLEDFYERWCSRELTEDDIRNFHYKLSLGDLDCTTFEVLEKQGSYQWDTFLNSNPE